MKYVFTVLFCLLIIGGCKKDEELISGEIQGYVALIGSNYNELPARKDIQVDLYNNSVRINTINTDENGRYLFEDLPYGRYDLRCFYPGFIRSFYQSPTFHIGGYSPTYADYSLYEVPNYLVEIDSVSFDATEDYLIIHLKVDGDTLAPGTSYYQQFRAFMSNSPDVSKDNYVAVGKGILADWGEDNTPGLIAVYGRMVTYEIRDFEDINSLPIYMVIYPIANNQGYRAYDYLPESLGPASNEVIFDWNELSGE